MPYQQFSISLMPNICCNLMYAIVDIETTGGYAANNAITEVAIVLHDGKGTEVV